MTKVLTFKVEIEGLENKIWRKIEIKESDTLADLCYFILVTFELYFIDFFTVTYDKHTYDSANYLFDNDDYKSVMGIKLKDIDFDTNKKMILNYDFKNKITFVINYIESKKVKEDDYPKITDGRGKGALASVSGEELKQIVDETDRLGYSNYSTTIEVDGKEEKEIFDYTDFDLKISNTLCKCNASLLKYDYESMDLADFLRIIKDNRIYFYKSDTKSIVHPYDFLKEYIPDNYEDLSQEEIDKLNIPDYEDLNIYRLPQYREINHKDIMTLYVKRNVEDKEIRQSLFYALRNNDYMDKFYNNLRKYGLFKDYLDYSYYYYKDIIKAWMEENNIKGN